MKTRVMSIGIITILFMATTLSGAINVSQFQSTPRSLASSDSQEMFPIIDNDSSSAIIAIGFFRVVINPAFSEIAGLGLPDKEGRYPVRIISNLHWTASGPRSMIFSYFPLTLRSFSYTGSTSGQSLFYVGLVKIETNKGLVRSTEYTFIGIAFSLKIMK